MAKKDIGAGIRTAVVYRTNAKNVVDEFEQVNYREGDQVQLRPPYGKK